MSPRKKTTSRKSLKHQRYEENCFRSRDAFEAFEAVIIVERQVDLRSLTNTLIPEVFKDLTWTPILIATVEVHDTSVREFFSNAFEEGDHLNYWVRGKLSRIYYRSDQSFLNPFFHITREEH